jgi:hypothetical protein
MSLIPLADAVYEMDNLVTAKVGPYEELTRAGLVPRPDTTESNALVWARATSRSEIGPIYIIAAEENRST